LEVAGRHHGEVAVLAGQLTPGNDDARDTASLQVAAFALIVSLLFPPEQMRPQIGKIEVAEAVHPGVVEACAGKIEVGAGTSATWTGSAITAAGRESGHQHERC